MKLSELEIFKKWSKDEKSFEKIKEVVEDLIKERNQAEEHLGLLESAIRSDYDSILITELNLEKPGPRIVYVNDGFCKMTGYSKEEVIGKTPRILQGPKTDRAVLDKLKSRLKEGQSFFGQAINYRKDGSEFVNQWDIHPLTDSKGNITHWVSYQHDITMRKRAEKHLVDQKLKFDELREESLRTVVDVDLYGNIVMANKSFRELIGYSKDELNQIKIWDLFPPKYKYSLEERFDNSDEEIHFEDEEFKGIINHQSGVRIQVKGKTHILDLKDQKLIRAEIENLSLKKRVVNTLKKRNDKYSRVVDKVSELHYTLTFKEGAVIFESISEGFPQITGLSEEAVLGKENAENFIHQDDIAKYQRHLNKVSEGEESTCAYRMRRKGGGYIRVLDYGKPERDDKNNTVRGAQCSVSVDEAYLKITEA